MDTQSAEKAAVALDMAVKASAGRSSSTIVSMAREFYEFLNHPRSEKPKVDAAE